MPKTLPMNTEVAIIALTLKGCTLGSLIAEQLNSDFFVPEQYKADFQGRSFSNLEQIFGYCFQHYRKIISIMAQGIVCRMIARLIKNKHVDPAVVVCDEVGRFALSMLSGHEGGANELAFVVSSITGAEPVITTASEANKIYVLGLGCRKNVSKEQILLAINQAMQKAKIEHKQIRLIASCWQKREEKGLIEAAKELGYYLRFLPKELYRNDLYAFVSSAASKYLDIKAVAEPSALLASKNPELVLKKTIFGPVTIAIAREKLING